MRLADQIYDGDTPVQYLNELEYIDGDLFANIYLSRKIVRISLKTDKIVGTYDFSFLLETANKISTQLWKTNIKYDECLNGIAYNRRTKQLILTGKNWPVMFDVEWKDPIFEDKP